MPDAIERVEEKVNAVIKEAFPGKADILDGVHVNNVAMKKYTGALTPGLLTLE